jgi:hypothetical protein
VNRGSTVFQFQVSNFISCSSPMEVVTVVIVILDVSKTRLTVTTIYFINRK